MDNKPMFCSECGARLTGSAAFCPACGAKQEFATAAVSAAPQPVAIPVVIPQAAPAVDVKPTPAPVVDVKPAPVFPALVAAPDNSLAAAKPKLSVIGLILAIAALAITGMAVLLQFVSVSRSWVYKIDFSLLGQFLRSSGVRFSVPAGFVMPIVAILAVLIKKKPVALVGMILTAVCMLAQLIVMLLFSRVVMGRVPYNFFGHLLLKLMNWVNGDSLLYNLQIIFRTGNFSFRSLFSAGMVSSFFYWGKNLLAILACLVVMVKKQK